MIAIDHAKALQRSSVHTGPTAKLEHVAERFSAFYTDLEQEKQVRTKRQHCTA